MNPANKKQISLLPSENDPNNIVNRTINWLTSVGRVIIIFTELIVVGAFVSRFWLDRTNADLSETLRQQKAIIDSTKEFQQDFSLVKARLDKIDKLLTSPNLSVSLNSIFKSTPSQIFFQKIQLSPNTDNLDTQLDIIAFDNNMAVSFISNLIANPDIESVSIRKIEKAPKTSFLTLALQVKFNQSFIKDNEI